MQRPQVRILLKLIKQSHQNHRDCGRLAFFFLENQNQHLMVFDKKFDITKSKKKGENRKQTILRSGIPK